MSRASRGERYTILSELGRGGMGVVSCAFDAVRGEQVALKRLAIERFETPQDRERATALFEREYHTLSQLAHPNVICVFDYGIDDDGPYYTMEHLRGDSLRSRTPLPWRDAARVVRGVASALAIVHSRRLVHRDVTPQNIYCDAESGAKLLDFGAMIPTGIAKQIVGTPPFIAPECLESQPLDGQTDLFSLGASLYFAVAGRHAYDARSIAQLPAAWQRRPVPLSQLVAGVPEALDALTESLLSLSPASRPRTAADVYERLTSIADLPRSESASVIRAYLTRPALIGRERELGYLRRRAQRATRGQGGFFVLAGTAGIGRTRLLDAAVLEARLAGFLVVRADASEARTPLAAIDRVVASLREAGALGEPELARYGLPLQLTHASEVLLASQRREHTLRDLASAVLELARQRPLAIAVDDLQALDEPSLAVLASLAAQAQGHTLWLVASLLSTAERRSPALRLLESSARHLPLRPLAPEACRALLSSVFGEATPNLDVFSALAERRCRGNARHLMECAQAAIDAGLARYAGGGWAITSDAPAIVETLDRLTDIEQQIATLSPDALELLQALSLDREAALDLADYPALTEHGDRARMHRALTELSDAGWLVLDTDRARFLRDDQLANVAARVPPERLRTFHARLARCCAKPELVPIYQAYHWLKAGQLERALRPMEAMTTFVDANPTADAVRTPLTMETLQIFSEMEGVPGAHPGSRANYTASLIVNAAYQGFPERSAELIPRALREIAPYTGVSDYAASNDLPEPERFQRALTRANERCQAPGVGGLDLVRFIRRQTQLCITVGACANFMADASLLAGLPDLTPFVALSPALGVAQRLIDALSKLARGQTWLAWDVFLAVHEELSASAQAQAIDGLTLLALRTPTLGYLGAIEAEHAAPATLTHLDDYTPLMGHNAQSLRARYHFASGDLANWARARQQSELLSVQSKSLLETRHTETAAYAGLFALAEDLLGLRRVHAQISELTKMRPGWRYREAIARCQILRCEDRCAEALAIAESSLASVPAQHSDYVAAAATHLELLLATQRREAARSAAQTYLARASAAELPTFRLELALARACAELGDHDSAERHYGDALRALEAREVRGLLLGRAFETGARVALERGDASAFEARAKRCAEHYAIKQNPTLATRFGQLMRDAARAGLISSGTASAGSEVTLQTLAANAEDGAFYAAALDHLVKRSGAYGGFLYVPAGEGLRCVARSDAMTWSDTASVDRAAHESFERFSDETGEDREAPTKLATAPASAARSGEFTLWPCAVTRTAGEGRTLEGVVVFVSNSASGAGVAGSSLEDLASLMTRRSAAPPLVLVTDDASTTQ